MPERFLRRNFCSNKIPFDILLYRGLFIAPRYIGKTDKTPFPKRPPQPCRRIGTVQKTHGTALFDFINNVTHAHVDRSEKGKSEIAATLRKPLKTNGYRAFDRFTRFCTSDAPHFQVPDEKRCFPAHCSYRPERQPQRLRQI